MALCLAFYMPIDVMMDNLATDRDRVHLMMTCKRMYAHRTLFARDWQVLKMVYNFDPATAVHYASHLCCLLQSTTAVARCDPNKLYAIVHWTVKQNIDNQVAHGLRNLIVPGTPADVAMLKSMWYLSAEMANAPALNDFTRLLEQKCALVQDSVQGALRCMVPFKNAPFHQYVPCLSTVFGKLRKGRYQRLYFPYNMSWNGQTFEQTAGVLHAMFTHMQPDQEDVEQFLYTVRPKNTDAYCAVIDPYAQNQQFSPTFWFAWFLQSGRIGLASTLLRNTSISELSDSFVFDKVAMYVEETVDLLEVLTSRDCSDCAKRVVELCIDMPFDTTSVAKEFLSYLSKEDVCELHETAKRAKQKVHNMEREKLQRKRNMELILRNHLLHLLRNGQIAFDDLFTTTFLYSPDVCLTKTTCWYIVERSLHTAALKNMQKRVHNNSRAVYCLVQAIHDRHPECLLDLINIVYSVTLISCSPSRGQFVAQLVKHREQTMIAIERVAAKHLLHRVVRMTSLDEALELSLLLQLGRVLQANDFSDLCKVAKQNRPRAWIVNFRRLAGGT